MVFAPLKKKYLGDILIEMGIINKDQLQTALKEQENSNEQIGHILIRLGYAKEKQILQAQAHRHGLVFKDLTNVQFPDELRAIVGMEMARKFNIMPVSVDGDDVITIAMPDPNDMVTIDELRAKTGKKINVVLASAGDIERATDRFYGVLSSGLDDFDGEIEEIDESDLELAPEGDYGAEDAPIVKYVNSLIHEAVYKNASDVHLEPMENTMSLRLRIDGKLQEFPAPSKNSYVAIVSRIKIMGNLNIAERRLPQDGKCRLRVGNKKVDVRISTLPTIHGEKTVLRILQRSDISLDMKKLGFSDADDKRYKEALESPHGMLLVTGPTGSGKTTTLYGGLNYINKPERNIITIEDPVEFELKRVNQVQVKRKIGLDFADVLRRVLRQDPDVIMVGEIRDKETATIAIQAALTGHLVLSTLHTNNAVGTLSRLKFMGVETFLVADAVILVMAQRLVRKICPNCKEEDNVPAAVVEKLGLPEEDSKIKFYHGTGCEECFGVGYKGRTAVYEVLKITPAIKKMIVTETNDIAIEERAMSEGMSTLRDGALVKLKEGITSVEEVLTVTFG